MADDNSNKKGGKGKKARTPQSKKTESIEEEGAYQDEKIFTVVYFHPTRYDDAECVPINCQLCPNEVTNGYICELNVVVDENGEEYLESFVLCEDCYGRFVEPMLDIVFRNIEDNVESGGNL